MAVTKPAQSPELRHQGVKVHRTEGDIHYLRVYIFDTVLVYSEK